LEGIDDLYFGIDTVPIISRADCSPVGLRDRYVTAGDRTFLKSLK